MPYDQILRTLKRARSMLEPVRSLRKSLGSCDRNSHAAQVWQMLYSSRKGKSFSILMGSILGRGRPARSAAPERSRAVRVSLRQQQVMVCAGPTLLLVRDKQGYLFGGYAASPWEKTGHFYGTSQNFIFSLQPDFALHRASGANSNYQW